MNPWNKVILYVAPLVGFTGQTVKSAGNITLLVSVKDTGHMVEFLIVSAPTLYNCITSRSILNQFQANISICELFIDIPIGEKIYTIYGEQKAAQESYFATMQKVEKEEESV